MIAYDYPNAFFRKRWVWFDTPHDVADADMVTFFSYDDVVPPEGFKKKSGLTTVIDLRFGLDAIWEGMRKKFVRKQIERGRRNGITVAQNDNFAAFAKLYQQFRADKSLPGERVDVFKNGTLFLACHEGRAVSGGVFIADGSSMRAWALASEHVRETDGARRDAIGQANRMLVWEAIRHAHENGYVRFDLGGMNPDAAHPHERSLAEFKEAFGGERTPHYYYTKTYSPLLRFLRRARSVLPS